jgi:hypothetical protein
LHRVGSIHRQARYAVVRTATVLGCNIKGNISLNTGEHIDCVPGQEHYSETVITTPKGECWFCSEDEARRWMAKGNAVRRTIP